MKDLLTNKRKLEDLDTVTLSGNCSAIIQKKLLKKLNDLGSFIIPCVLGEGMQENALADSGEMRKPRGVVQNVLVRVDKLIIPVEFVILDVDDDVEVPLILGCLFLNSSRTLIDNKGWKMTLRVGDEQVVFTLPEAMKHTLDYDDTLYFTDVTNVIIYDYVQKVLTLNPLDEYFDGIEIEETEVRDPLNSANQKISRVEVVSPLCCKKKKTLKKA
ncbi:uncharacterized protein LOC120262175 [Dioscorea cayenensis subsp. rotundata]|uniref:Uncharacterized protein LOC120262175 n=1 Tax=Dioscorea cayennensis subsp. rotundata TaxID=55577 RepID=A0AB40BFV1_DIOCR|nr:uncharacterized protein LOC120262175 [Dioscorea cayenensis subsp. rotundata]